MGGPEDRMIQKLFADDLRDRQAVRRREADDLYEHIMTTTCDDPLSVRRLMQDAVAFFDLTHPDWATWKPPPPEPEPPRESRLDTRPAPQLQPLPPQLNEIRRVILDDLEIAARRRRSGLVNR